MTGVQKLAGSLLVAFNRVERDLALLYGGRYFTEDQWIQVDFLIHQGQYVFTNGPSNDNSLIDFFAPLDNSYERDQKRPEVVVEDRDIDLLVSTDLREPKSTEEMAVMTKNTATPSYNCEESQWETATVDQETAVDAIHVPQQNYNYPHALQGHWNPGQEVHATLTALKAAHSPSDLHLDVEVGDAIRIHKNVSKHTFTGKNLRSHLFGQLHEEIFHLGDRASVEALLAGLRGKPMTARRNGIEERKETVRVDTPEVKGTKGKAQSKANATKEKQERLYGLDEVENVERDNAKEWEDEDEPTIPPSIKPEQDYGYLEAPEPRLTAIRTPPRASSRMDLEVGSSIGRCNSPSPSVLSTSVSAEAAEAITALRLEFDARDARLESRISRLIERIAHVPSNANITPQAPKLDRRVCYYWATPGKVCRYTAATCHKIHYYPEPTAAQAEKPPKIGRPNKKWESRMDPTSSIISTEKHKTCPLWINTNDCPSSEENCKYSHRHTGEVAPGPFWCSKAETEDEVRGSVHGSSTSEEEHADIDAKSLVDCGASSSDNDGNGEEAKDVSDLASITVKLGSDNTDDNGVGKQLHNSNDTSAVSSWGWADTADPAVQTLEKKTMILGAAAGGWGNENVGVDNDDGWNTVSSKKKGKSDKVIW